MKSHTDEAGKNSFDTSKSTSTESGKAKSKSVRTLEKNSTMTSSVEEKTSPDGGRFTKWLVCSVLAATLGSSFVFGYNIGVINVAGNKIKRWIVESQGYTYRPLNKSDDVPSDVQFLESLSDEDKTKVTLIWSLVGGFFPLGAMFGGLSVGFAADKLGRKGAMLANNLLTIVAGLILASSKGANTFYVLILGRFIIGLSCGLNSGLAPMYLTEISPINLRGFLGSACQLVVTISILVACIVGMDSMLGTESLWPYLLGFTIVPSVWQVFVMPFCPESPKYLLITKGDTDKAHQALVTLRQTDDVSRELNAMKQEAEKVKSSPAVKFTDMFRVPMLRWPVILAIMMMLSQQLSGINATMFYSTIIFEKDAQLSTRASMIATLSVMIVNVLMTVVSTAVVDRAGRRTLFLASLGGMLVTTVLLVITLDLSGRGFQWAAYASILFVVLFVISFATGSGSIPWFFVSELFEQGARGYANSIAVGTNWFATFLIGFSFPPVQSAFRQYTFLIFTTCLTVFMAFFWKYLPETKGKSIDQVMKELRVDMGQKPTDVLLQENGSESKKTSSA